jgi:nucleoside-diphosphate-sugar epimerase
MDNNVLNIFVTGGQTNVGLEAVRQATARGHKVTALVVGSEGGAVIRSAGGLPAYSEGFRVGELKSLMAMAQADVVLHLATQVINGFPARGHWEAHEHLLTDGVSAMLEAARTAGVKFLVYAGYASVYGDSHGEWLTEDAEGHADPAFRVVRQAEQRVLESGVPACILRAGFNYGASETGTQTLLDAIRSGRYIYTGDSHRVFNWVHGADLARAALLAAEKQPVGESINIVDDHPASAAEFAAHLAASVGAELPGRKLPGFMLERTTSEKQRALLSMSSRLRNDRAKEILGWKPRYPDYRAGIEQTLLEWRAAPVQG